MGGVRAVADNLQGGMYLQGQLIHNALAVEPAGRQAETVAMHGRRACRPPCRRYLRSQRAKPVSGRMVTCPCHCSHWNDLPSPAGTMGRSGSHHPF